MWIVLKSFLGPVLDQECDWEFFLGFCRRRCRLFSQARSTGRYLVNSSVAMIIHDHEFDLDLVIYQRTQNKPPTHSRIPDLERPCLHDLYSKIYHISIKLRNPKQSFVEDFLITSRFLAYCAFNFCVASSSSLILA